MFGLIERARLGACALLVIGATATASAVPLTLADAVARTLARNPELRSFPLRSRAQEARAEIAALNPPLELRAELQDVFGTGRASSLDTAEATLAISQVVELGDKRGLRVAAANATVSLIDTERAAAELDVLAEVTRRFIHVVSDQEQLALTARAAALAAQTLEAATARVAAARAPEVEMRRARVTVVRARIDREHAEHELLASRRKLAALWGDSDATFDSATADLFGLPSADTFEMLRARLDANPDFLRFASEARLRDAEIRVAEAQARANLTVTAGLKRLEETNDEAFVLAVNVPLFAAKRARGAIAEARAERELTDVERDARRVRAEAELFDLYQELKHAITEAEALRNDVLPELEAALAATRYAFERGRYSYLEWVDAQRELVAAERASIEAAANAHLFRAEIERLTGESLPTAHRENPHE